MPKTFNLVKTLDIITNELNKNMPNYLFSTGTARGGTGLLAHMLSVNNKVKVVSDPFLALFKSFRNSVVKNDRDLKYNFDLSSPFGDNYFTVDRRKLLDLILESDVNLDFDKTEWNILKEHLKKRARLASADIIPFINELEGNTYKQIFESCFSMLSKIRSPNINLDWIGIHENWTVDFFLPFAKEFKNAKFIIIIRDPRAVFTSNSREKDKSVIGHVLSYARCHRKLMSCAAYYETLPIFNKRLQVIRYENLLIKPKETCIEICDFLEINFDPNMLDTTQYVNHSTGGIHNGASNYEENAQGFNTKRIDRWRNYLSVERTNLIDFICGPEMLLYKYQTDNIDPFSSALTNSFDTIISEMSGYKAWRSDFIDPIQDYGYELVRREMLIKKNEDQNNYNENLIKRCFLFPEIFKKINLSRNLKSLK